MTTAEARTKLHDLIEALPSDDVPTALRILESMTLRDVPLDDEPETDDERQAVAEARRDVENGCVIPHDEVMRKYGL